MDAIRRQHIEIPGGKLESREKEFLIRTMGEFESPEAFNDLIISYKNGTPIRLRRLGYAEAGREESVAALTFTTKEGTEKAVALGVAPRSGANEVAIAQEVKAALQDIRKMLPKGMYIKISSDNTVFVEESINEVKFHLLLGAIMAVLVILLFLQDIRCTVFSTVAIPTSIIATFACIYALGLTLNNMTMLALITAVGLVIDDAIVVVENIFRHRVALGKGPMKAAREGSSEVAFAVSAATFALAGVFVPVAFMGGMVGSFFYQFAANMAFAVACSLFVTLTVVPMLSSRFLTISEDKGWIFTLVGKEFVTAADQDRILIRIEAPLLYSLEKTEDVMRRLGKGLEEIEEIQHFFFIAGEDGANKGLSFIRLIPKRERIRSQQDIQSQVRRLLSEIPDIRGSASDISPLGGMARNEDIQFVVQGPDIDAIDSYSHTIMDRLAETPGYMGVTRDLEIGKPEVRVRIDREKAADAGISVRSIASAVGALLGGIDVADYKEGGKTYDIRLRLVEEQRLLPEDVQRIWIRSKTGILVDISNFTSIDTGVGPNVINRLDRQRSATIYANLEGKLMGEAMPEVQQVADEILSEGYTTTFSGRGEAYSETGDYILFAFILAIILTYMVLAVQFESFSQPFAIMTGLPLSFIRAFGMLFLLNNTFNLFSMIGLVLLIGLATKNGILLVDYTNQLRANGMSVHDALVEAGATRLRPILMTATSTVAGIIPVAIGMGVGSESRQPMAVAISGGLVSSTFLTLAVVPVIYSYLDQFANWRLFGKFKEKIMANGKKP